MAKNDRRQLPAVLMGDVRCIWSLGVALYELMQGAPPFRGDAFSSIVLKAVNDPLPKLTVRLPGDLAAIVYRCLEKDPARRFQSTAELAHAIVKPAQSETQAAISVQRTRGIVGWRPREWRSIRELLGDTPRGSRTGGLLPRLHDRGWSPTHRGRPGFRAANRP
jgi:serine/threonine protein kinase